MVRKVMLYLGIGIGTIVGIALLLNVVMTFLVGGRQVTVPDVRGLRHFDAATVLRDCGLKNEIIADEFNVEYPESTVCAQDPVAGRIVKQGRRVRITMSKGGEFHDVPYCVGKPLRTARIVLERAGFRIGHVSRVTTFNGYPEEVLSTEPLPGSQMVKGSIVNLLVNDGPPITKMLLPDLRGEPYLGVKMKLERLGLFVDESSLDGDLVPLRSVIVLHEPPAGHIVARGDTITLVVSSRKQERQSL